MSDWARRSKHGCGEGMGRERESRALGRAQVGRKVRGGGREEGKREGRKGRERGRARRQSQRPWKEEEEKEGKGRQEGEEGREGRRTQLFDH